MKRFAEKIGIKRENAFIKPGVTLVFLASLSLILSSCEKPWHGRDGRTGDAFLALTWQVEPPAWIDAGTGAIPPVFNWGAYYRVMPGYYTLYYEGRVWTGSAMAHYAWEVTYEVWVVAGEPGDWYYNGADGPDNYFTIECSPYGPYIWNSYKSLSTTENTTVVRDTGDEIVILQKGMGMSMKATYRRMAEMPEKE